MKYYIAADGGGSKLFAVLYDENFNIISSAKCGGTNNLFRPAEEIEDDVNALVEALIPDDVKIVEGFDHSIVGDVMPILRALEKKVIIRSSVMRNEGESALLSSCYEYGIVAQAGTGSDAYLFQPDGRTSVGGWGQYFGDEGSGYDIGNMTIRAAIYAFDGRGPKTVIKDTLMREWGLSNMWEIFPVKVRKTRDVRKLIASAAPICGAAAALGDEVAIGIFRNAAESMAHQVKIAIKKYGDSWVGPIVMSGGAWKSSHYFKEFFREIILRDYPDAEVITPLFEPVVGSVVLRHKEHIPLCELRETLKIKFKEFLLR